MGQVGDACGAICTVKRFWRVLEVQSTSLVTAPVMTYMEGDHMTIVAGDTSKVDATNAQKRAYQVDTKAHNYLMLCLKHMPELQQEAKGTCPDAHAMFNYLQAKFKLRDLRI